MELQVELRMTAGRPGKAWAATPAASRQFGERHPSRSRRSLAAGSARAGAGRGCSVEARSSVITPVASWRRRAASPCSPMQLLPVARAGVGQGRRRLRPPAVTQLTPQGVDGGRRGRGAPTPARSNCGRTQAAHSAGCSARRPAAPCAVSAACSAARAPQAPPAAPHSPGARARGPAPRAAGPGCSTPIAPGRAAGVSRRVAQSSAPPPSARAARLHEQRRLDQILNTRRQQASGAARFTNQPPRLQRGRDRGQLAAERGAAARYLDSPSPAGSTSRRRAVPAHARRRRAGRRGEEPQGSPPSLARRCRARRPDPAACTARRPRRTCQAVHAEYEHASRLRRRQGPHTRRPQRRGRDKRFQAAPPCTAPSAPRRSCAAAWHTAWSAMMRPRPPSWAATARRGVDQRGSEQGPRQLRPYTRLPAAAEPARRCNDHYAPDAQTISGSPAAMAAARSSRSASAPPAPPPASAAR